MSQELSNYSTAFNGHSALWLILIEEGHDNSKFIFWMDFELRQFSKGLKHMLIGIKQE